MNSIRALFFILLLSIFQQSFGEIRLADGAKNVPLSFLLTLPQKNNQSNSEISLVQFKQAVVDYAHCSKNQLLSGDWLHGKNPCIESFFDGVLSSAFMPFAQKMVVPSGSRVAFFGDLHGNIESISKILIFLKKHGYLDANLKILKKDFFMIFLGDYVDRGDHGVEVLYTLLSLKIANPEKVFLVRGNHEDRLLNTVYGFRNELRSKFPSMQQQEIDAVFRCYDFMPTVLFLGSGEHNDFIQCCHGGMEIGYCAKALVSTSPAVSYEALGEIDRIEAVRELPSHLKQEVVKKIPSKEIANVVLTQPTQPLTLGFMWNDFIENVENYTSSIIDYSNGRGWIYGKQLTAHLLKKNSSKNAQIRAVFRAHQHHGGMLKLLQQEKGIVKLWDGMVHTFLTASLPHVEFVNTSLGILTTADYYNDWSLEHIIL